MLDVDKILLEHFDANFTEEKIAHLRDHYLKHSVVPLRNFIPPTIFEALKSEAEGVMEAHGVARDFNLEITDNTPRHMTTVGQPVISKVAKIIPAMYESKSLVSIATQLVGEQVFECPYLGERYVLSSMKRSGDTHGWHWDDYAMGMVWVLEAPDPHEGGFVQCVPNTSWDKSNPDVYGAMLQQPIYSYAFEPGDAYIIRADTTMHRVHPIRGEGKRLIVNTTWAFAEDLKRTMTHETNDVLFGGSTAYVQ